jgi:anti-sigma factor RsiW
MTSCERFLAGYSAFRDDALPWEERMEMEVHLDECPSCAKYDRVVSRGTEVFRELPQLEVSEDFAARLQHRIYTEDLEAARARNASRSATALATMGMAAAIAAAAWVPLVRQYSGGEAPLQSAASTVPFAERLAAWDGPAHREAGRVTSQLARLGVAVTELPYHDLVFKKDGPLVTTVAAYTEGDLFAR